VILVPAGLAAIDAIRATVPAFPNKLQRKRGAAPDETLDPPSSLTS
jgi:hypothetical protein